MADGSIQQLLEKYPWVSRATAPMVEQDNAIRIAWILKEEHFVNTPQTQAALAAMKFVLTQQRRRRMDCIYIGGVSGTGKTMVAKRFFKKMGIPTEQDDLTVRIINGMAQVIAVDISGVRNEQEFYATIARACTVHSCKPLNYSPDAVLRMVADAGATALLIDEADRLAALPRGDQESIIWQMKYLTNNTQVGIIALGTHSLDNFIRLEDTLKQRFRSPVLLTPLETLSSLRHFANHFGMRMPMRHKPNIDNPTFMRKLMSKTGGRQPEVNALMRAMGIHAIVEGVDELNLQMLKLAISKPFTIGDEGEDENA